ncbi:MAG: hypothetical protein EOP11_04050, partial [Proteobacteria bacterium]
MIPIFPRVFAAALLLALLLPTAEAAPLSLAEAIRYALDHSPRIDTAAKEATIATLARKNAGAAFLPTLDVTANLGRRGYSPTFPETRTAADGSLIFPGINPWTSGLTAQLSENLFDNGLSIDRYKIANLREEQATVQALDNRDQVFLEIGQRFYQYSLDRKLLALQEDQFGIL